MTGPDHYREAERLLAGTQRNGPWADGSGARVEPPSTHDIAKAQVHATLAQAAATAMLVDEPVNAGWVEVAR